MSKFAKIFCWFSIINGALTLAAPLLLAIWGRPAPLRIGATWCALGLIGIVGGTLASRGRAWGFWLLFACWLVQIAEYLSASLVISFIGPLAMKVGWGYLYPPSQVSLNLLAICLAIVSASLATTPVRSIKAVSNAA